jgi:hypothetical protein
VDWSVESNVSEKRVVSIFRAKVVSDEFTANPHGDLTQRNIIRIVTAVKILNLTQIYVV